MPASNHPRLTDAEMSLITSLLSTHSTQDILATLQQKRRRRSLSGPSQSAVYRFVAGETYIRGAAEKRGASNKIPDKVVKELDKTRLRLAKEAASDYFVTWEDVVEEGKKDLRKKGLLGKREPMWSPDAVARRSRELLNVRRKPSRKRLARTRGEEKERYEKALEWSGYAARHWKTNVHAYIDNKKFLVARTAKEKKLLRTARVHSHLRKPSEGSDPAFVTPKANHIKHGMKSVEVTCAVAKNKVILWHVTEGPWNGDAAAIMYKGLGAALRKEWGNKRKFVVVEDGDRKGFQSGKGRQAKEDEKIDSWQLPPRTPELMPLDFYVWSAIGEKMAEMKPHSMESFAQYKARLRKTAFGLPADSIEKAVMDMKKRVDGLVTSKGSHLKWD